MYQQLKCRSFAKLNLCLHVLNKRNDGYHELESIFESINLYDELSFKRNNSNSIRFTSDSKKINPLDNLITKAYKEISNILQYTRHRCSIKKKYSYWRWFRWRKL